MCSTTEIDDITDNERTISCDRYSANTEESLLSSTSTSTEEDLKIEHGKIKNIIGESKHLLIGFLCLGSAILLSIWTPFQFLMKERSQMRPGLPPYEWWKTPPDQGILNIYIFNLTNAEEFLNGKDAKMKLKEVGPIVFHEVWKHSDIIFNDNGTMTYTAKRTAVYDASLNTLDLNESLVIPNMGLLGSASYVHDSSLIIKLGFQSIANFIGSKPVIEIPIENFLYNFTDPFLSLVHNYIPDLAPVNNLGLIYTIYQNFIDNVTAYIGNTRGYDIFSLIDKYNGDSVVPGHDNFCKDVITNATEGIIFNQFISKQQKIRYFRKSLCRVVPLEYEKEGTKYGLKSYKFTMKSNALNRTTPLEDDCYKSNPPLMDGLSDLSKCLYSFPMAASFPHFLYGDDRLSDYVDGLEPNVTKHLPYVIVEPITGIPLESRAAIQVNINMRKLTGFSSMFDKFSDMIVPIFWLEYCMYELPLYILVLIHVTLAMRYVQWIFVILLLIFGFRSIRCYAVKKTAVRNDGINLQRNKVVEFERQTFLNK